MKKLGQFCALVTLILSAALTSYAGHIDCPITNPPPSPDTSMTATEPTAIETSCIDCEVMVIVQSLLQGMLPLV